MEGFKAINIFLLKIFGFYFFWLISDNYLSHNLLLYNKIWTYFYHVLLLVANNSSAFLLDLYGYEVVHNYRSIAIVGSYGVVIGDLCAGFGLIYSTFALFISYPAPTKSKLWFVPLSIFLVILANIARVMLLTIAAYNHPEIRYNEQHEFFNNVIYILVFVLWIVWVQFIVPFKKKSIKS